MNPDEGSDRVDPDAVLADAIEKRLRDLSLRPNCTRQEITRTYHQFAQQIHPDRGGDAAAFQRLQHEYEAALSRLARSPSASYHPIVLQPSRPAQTYRSLRLLLPIVVTVFIAVFSYFLNAADRWMLFSLVLSSLALVGLPSLLSNCRPSVAAILALSVIFVAGEVLAAIVMSGMLQEALHPTSESLAADLQRQVTISLTLLSGVSVIASILGFLFSVSYHGID